MAKHNKALTLGQKLLKLRKKKKLSLDELSEKTGLKSSHLKSIEEGKDFAPVGDILKISKVLTVDPGEFLKAGEDRKKELKKQRIQAFKKRESSYQYQVLTPDAKNKHIRVFQVTIPPKSEHPKISYQHEGEEFIYTLRGEVEIKVGQKKYHLKKDESLHFNSGLKHSLKNPGPKKTLLLVTVYTP